jgi:hypothetical protein
LRRRPAPGLRSGLAILALWLLLGAPGPARAQLFFASRPDPGFTIGPLLVRASVGDDDSPALVSVQWSLVLLPGRGAADLGQDLYLLWPGEVASPNAVGPRDPALARYVEELGFAVVGEGRLPLLAQSLAQAGAEPVPLPEGAPFVIFVRDDALGLSPSATFIRIPWTPRLAEPKTLMELRMRVAGLVKPRKATWAERLFVGGRYLVTVGFNEVRDRPLFPMYFAHRDRVVRLADAPSELAVTFARSDNLKIDAVFPPTSIRRLSETQDSTEVVSLFLDRSDGITPQQLAVQFGYFSRLQAAALVLIPMLFFVLGNAMGPVLGRAALRASDALRARVHLGAWKGGPRSRESGVIVSRDVLARIVPGQTTREEIVRLCGEEVEEREQLAAPERRTLIYRGRRVVPAARRVFGWVSTVSHWKVERQEVRIELERGVVRDVEVQVGYSRLGAEEAA